MRMFTLLIILQFILVGHSRNFNDIEVTMVNIMSYNSVYKSHRAGGMVYSDSADLVQKEYMSCCYDDESLFFYQHKSYFENGNIKLDSTIDMMPGRKLK